jgi:hypothetical protein
MAIDIVANYWFTEYVGPIPTCLISYLIFTFIDQIFASLPDTVIDFRLHTLTVWLVKLQ